MYHMKIIKSPLNYTGGKYKLLPQLLPLFPQDINIFVDLFTGGANVGVNVEAKKIICNDNISFLIELYQKMAELSIDDILNHIDMQIKRYDLSLTNIDGFNALREDYNMNKNPLDLFVLISYSFNHQMRFNNAHQYNSSFGKERSQFNDSIRQNLIDFVVALHSKDISFECNNFDEFNFSILGKDDFIYLDPPYLISTANYNDGRRGFTGWNNTQDAKLLTILDELSTKGIRFALSNVIEHKGIINNNLLEWSQKYNVINIDTDYSNSNYHAKNKHKPSVEVLITNYDI